MTNNNPLIDTNILEQLFTNHQLRIEVTSKSHPWFFHTYFANYVTCQTADLHRDLFAITEDESIPLAVIVAFRGSGKSTIMTLSYPIWAVLGCQQKKFVLIVSQTQYQARVHLMNIKRELESNELLKNDLGPFTEESDEWGASSIYIPRYNARITAISTDQGVRGVRQGPHRPDLIIADDVEDMSSVKTREGRNKTFDWYTGEIIPAGDTNTKMIVVGNLLHEDSLLMRLRDRMESGEIEGVYRAWPILKDGASQWPGKYPDIAAINKLRSKIGNRIAWEREFMLRIVADEDQVIDGNWIKFYDELPAKTEDNEYINSFVATDLAISQSDSADYTAIVTVHLFGYEAQNRRYFVDRLFINKRMSHNETLATIVALCASQDSEQRYKPVALVEQVQYQAAVVEQLLEKGIRAKGIRVASDKRARLQLASPLFEQGRVFLPNTPEAKIIAQQLTGFGVERYDDLVDAISLGLNYIQTNVRWQQILAVGIIDRSRSKRTCIFGIKYLDEQKPKK